MTKLSVIIPCYNCQDTLEEAIASLFRQEPAIPFDLTMVDDGSTDGTYEVMLQMARGHGNARVLRHDTNRGGGAARNTGIAGSDGDLIFCLDGDDILGPDFLANITKFWIRRRCDAVGMSTSIKFQGSNTKNVAYVTRFEPAGQSIPFESFLDGTPSSLHVVFLMTRAAYQRVGGYPTEHGFDTQGMGFRFLASGLRAMVCPETTYYHRVGLSTSYYKREESEGRLNWNWFNVLDEFLYLFRDSVKKQLLERDLFDAPGHSSPQNLPELFMGKPNIYAPEYRRLVRMGPRSVARLFSNSDDPFRQYWLGNFHRSNGRFQMALSHYGRALALGFDFRIIYYRMLQAELGLAGSAKGVDEALDDLVLYSRTFPLRRRPLTQRLYHDMMRRRGLGTAARSLKALGDRMRGKKSG